MSDTPRVDAVFPLGRSRDGAVPHDAVELAGLARQLERELAAANNNARSEHILMREATKELTELKAELTALHRLVKASFDKLCPKNDTRKP